MYSQKIPCLSDYGNDCPKCGGTGYIMIKNEIEGYGEIEEAKACPVCKGQKRTSDVTGVPVKYFDANLTSFDFKIYSANTQGLQKVINSYFEKYELCKKQNKGLYLWSKTPGTGKTFLTCCLARSIMMKYDLQMRFVTVLDYLRAVAESCNRQQGTEDTSEIYRECELLVLDDLGTQKNGEWQEQEIFRLINERQNNGKIMLFTSNYPPEQLRLSDRTIDRILKGSIVLQMPEESIRRMKAQKEQERFLKEILGN